MQGFIDNILQYLFQGGATSVIALMFTIIVALVYERISILKSLSSTTQKIIDSKEQETAHIKEILDRYHQGNLNLVEALNEIKLVLITLQRR